VKYKVVGGLIDLADGSPGEPGSFVNLSAEEAKDPHNEALISEGRLVKASEKADKKEGGDT
jgi:hypothetical protein